MKKYSKAIVIAVIAFLLGGAFIADRQGTNLWAALTEGPGAGTIIEYGSNPTVAAVPLPSGTMNIADMVEKATPAVVNIKSKIKVNSVINNPFFNDPFFREFFGDNYYYNSSPQYETGIGTGFLITADGYILTNQHVIENADSITVQLNGKTEEVSAQVIGQDRDLDLAVLKIEGSGFPVLKLGDSSLMRVGEWVVAIGQPYGLDHTVTTGVISAKGRPINIEDRSYKNLIQTDAAINPGNSGGPLLNLNGEVIAINTAVNVSAQGIGFAIPSDTVQEVLDDLIQGNDIIRPFLGVSMSDINEEIRQQLSLGHETRGILVVEVVKGTAAEKAGIKAMDIITDIDGEKISSAEQLQDIVSGHEVGDKITLNILRNGKALSFTANLQAKPQQ